MLAILKAIGYKNILIALLITVVAVWISYQVTKYKQMVSELEESKKVIFAKDEEIKEKNKNFDLAVEAYEKTIVIERETAKEKAVVQEQKEVVVTKYKTLIKEVEKRGEIKQDEKSNFTIVTF